MYRKPQVGQQQQRSESSAKLPYQPPSVTRERLDAVVKSGGNGSIDSPFGTRNEVP